ncbi:MAG: bifunctional hydroxymethylpyrimidine kinase/phosphomethylpyrimidine kinase [Chloracidobacterium sp.]|uniref:hydroxymethylpyrimidine kinase n=1 Tax=Chloracidobacterium validum TaxID=2821543 RepID=A0ABX8BA04_9BACT|nr:bifunctional hydroxymethylpyrimidine kinase/phosphomethylpyrimidine kinase [Chloracidobacterium validum]QUW03761.1 bifunctional hydroxymethylpyrimidine kinase/phosphomethylpyrimidine kinase [Chloracidobacterium validum]
MTTVVLSIAGLDPAGGAGLLADLKTVAACGAHGVGALTATTAQNTVGVKSFHPLPPDVVVAQLAALREDLPIAAAKTGMLATAGVVEAVADWLAANWRGPLVVDPVLVSSSGHLLLEPDAIAILKNKLLPLATVVTPNLPEARELTGLPVETVADMERAARALQAMGARYALVKGGHLTGDATDVLFDGRDLRYFSGERIVIETHGTGCTLSAALATHLGQGQPVTEAVARAKAYVREAMARAVQLGKGKRLLGHLPLA